MLVVVVMCDRNEKKANTLIFRFIGTGDSHCSFQSSSPLSTWPEWNPDQKKHIRSIILNQEKSFKHQLEKLHQVNDQHVKNVHQYRKSKKKKPNDSNLVRRRIRSYSNWMDQSSSLYRYMTYPALSFSSLSLLYSPLPQSQRRIHRPKMTTLLLSLPPHSHHLN